MTSNYNLPPGCTGREDTFSGPPIVLYECKCGHWWCSEYWPDGEECKLCHECVKPNEGANEN